MKTWVQLIGSVALALVSNCVFAQSEVNAYGPPRFTGGTVASTSEVFALYQHGLQNSVRETQPTQIDYVYPNPATSTTQIVLGSVPVGMATLSIFNTNGVLAKTYQFAPGSSRMSVDVSFLPQGVYSLQLQEEGKEAQSVQLSKY